ncbi:hypothetical protein EVG20_g3846 [Dentipellis fragilis]|uniref:Structure-specific endonuclease subunit SLX4 n=1 Tax=Dentipellis fragilis TaxID=205917 RepID=A0A4Y9Z1C1_9AGAM|nr:hypothetical protein EVG20_g3846 [Dentipellis fragilis]
MDTIAPAELVDDSEPEREDFRRRLKTAKKSNKRRNPESLLQTNNLVPALLVSDAEHKIRPLPFSLLAEDVIELSDSESTDAEYRGELRLIRGSGNNAGGLCCGKSTSPVDLESSSASSLGCATLPDASGKLISKYTRTLSSIGDDDDDDDGQFRVSIERFAYSQEQPPKRQKSVHTTSSESEANKVAAASPLIKSKKPATSRVQLRVIFPQDSDLSTVLKCICCGITWTVRKTAIQKLNHIRSCAKKRGLTQGTLDALISQESCKITTDSGLAKLPTTSSEVAAPKTFLEEIVDNTTLAKRSKRAKVTSTIAQPNQIRTGILDRARVLLKDDLEQAAPEPTQVFGQSKFRTTSLRASEKSPSETPPLVNRLLSRGNEEERYTPTDSADEAYLHYEPSNSPRMVHDSIPLSTGIQVSSSLSDSGEDDGGVNRLVSKPLAPKPTSKNSRQKKDASDAVLPLDNALFEKRLKALIRDDESLHLRILRYEPINFETFMTIAQGIASSSRGLKIKVRDFLDKQAINFYDSEASGSRTKKRWDH